MLQLPAVNTPQFDWVRSRLPHRAQPVPPVFQPEVIADAVVWVAEHEREEMYLGFPAVKAIAATACFPGCSTATWGGPATARSRPPSPKDPDRPDNLWHPVDADVGAHGRFDAIARRRSWQIWLSEHRAALALAGVGGVWRRWSRAGGGRAREPVIPSAARDLAREWFDRPGKIPRWRSGCASPLGTT